jgi:protein tyrosine phosphatase (PTP) superfamily phosphohydrolase (DUF442 family)
MTMDISTTSGRIAPGSTCTWWTTARSAPCTTTSTISAAACTAPASPARRRSQVPAKFGLRSIINLRGAHGYGSYALEKEACEKLGMALHDVKLYSRTPPEIEEVHAMDELFKTIEYPALLHCKSGADRAGLGAALYRILHLGHRSRTPWPSSAGSTATSRAPRPACWILLRHLRGPQRQSPIGFLEWVDTEYNRLELHARFREEAGPA